MSAGVTLNYRDDLRSVASLAKKRASFFYSLVCILGFNDTINVTFSLSFLTRMAYLHPPFLQIELYAYLNIPC